MICQDVWLAPWGELGILLRSPMAALPGTPEIPHDDVVTESSGLTDAPTTLTVTPPCTGGLRRGRRALTESRIDSKHCRHSV